MLLGEYLASLPGDTIVSIGASSGYMYIGPCKCLDEIEAVFDNCRKCAEVELKYLTALRRRRKQEDRNLTFVNSKIASKKKYLREYVDALDREICDTYERLTVPGIGIKVAGDEKSVQWVKGDDEYGQSEEIESLKKARKRAGLTQQEVASKVGITLRYYAEIESGRQTGSTKIQDAIKDILQLN